MKKIVLLVIFLLVAGGGFFFYRSYNYCDRMYDEIRGEIEEANYCEVNEDCKTLILSEDYSSFGCYHFVNKETDKNYFYDKMREYNKDCIDIINLCAPAPEPRCIEGKCAYVGE